MPTLTLHNYDKRANILMQEDPGMYLIRVSMILEIVDDNALINWFTGDFQNALSTTTK